jgi:hypothetical protein
MQAGAETMEMVKGHLIQVVKQAQEHEKEAKLKQEQAQAMAV